MLHITTHHFLIFSDPYVRIDLVANNGEQVIDSVLTRTKKRVW